MKTFFKMIFIFFGIIILIPVLAIVLLIDGSKPPVEMYRDNEDFEIMDVVKGSLNTMLDDAEHNDFKLELTEDELNTFIFQQLRNINANYLIDDEPENAYFMTQDFAGLVGVWSTLKNDTITIKIRADLLKPVKFKSSISLVFKFNFNDTTDNKVMTLQLSSAKIGKLTLPISLVNKIAEMAGLDLKGEVEKVLTIGGVQIGEFVADTWTVKVDKITLVETLLGNDPQTSVFVTVIKVLTTNKLIDVKFSKDNISAQFNSTKLYLDGAFSTLPEHLQLNDEDEKNLMLSNKKVDLLLSGFVSSEDRLSANLTETDFNRILDYYFVGMANLNQDIEIGSETFQLIVGSPWVVMQGGAIKFNVRVVLQSTLDPTKKFITVLVIDIDVAQQGSDVNFELGALAIGQDISLSKDDTAGILGMLGASDFVNENMMVINDFLTKFSTEEMVADGVIVKDGYILFNYKGNTPDSVEAIGDVKTHISAALAAVMVMYPELQTDYTTFTGITNPTVDDLQVFLDAIYTKLGDDRVATFGDDLVTALVVAKIGSIIPQVPTP